MIAEQRNEFALLFDLDQAVHHGCRVPAHVDEITQRYGQVRGLRLDGFEDGVDRMGAPMNIAHCYDPPVGCHALSSYDCVTVASLLHRSLTSKQNSSSWSRRYSLPPATTG